MKSPNQTIGSNSPILVWDTSDVDEEVEYRLNDEFHYEREDWLDEYKKDSGKTDVSINDVSFQMWINEKKKESLQLDVLEDTDHWEAEWDFLIDSLQEILNRKSLGNCKWKINGFNMGWTHRSGYKYIDCENKKVNKPNFSDAREFLCQILPNTDCTFNIYDEGPTLRIVNYHHDAPTGETYICIPCREEEWQEKA